MTLTVYTFIYIGIAVGDGDTVAHTCFLDSRMAINVIAYRLRRMELNNASLTMVFVQLLSSKKYTTFHNGVGLNPHPHPFWLRHSNVKHTYNE